MRDVPFQEGEELEVILIRHLAQASGAGGEAPEKERISARTLLQSPLVGLWKDRSDIKDSVSYARKLREQAERRGSS